MEHRSLRRAVVALAAVALLTLAPIASASAAPIPAPGPLLVADKLVLDFGHGAVGVPSVPQIVTLSNDGTADVIFAAVPAIANFPVTTTCGATLAPHATCTYSIVHTATVTGFHGGTLTFASNAATVTVDLNAYGGPAPAGPGLVATPLSIDFGSISAGQSTSRTFTYFNEGDAAVTGLTPSAVSAPFSYTTTCGNQLAPLLTCTFTVTYAPTAAGVATAAVSPQGNPASVDTVTLRGTGRPAVAAADAAYTTPIGTPLVISDPTLGFVGVSSGYVVDSLGVATQPSSGTVAAANDGTWTYTPTVSFSGTVTFTYGVEDYFGLSDTGTMTITVGAAPTATPVGPTLAATGTEHTGVALLAGGLLGAGLLTFGLTAMRRRRAA